MNKKLYHNHYKLNNKRENLNFFHDYVYSERLSLLNKKSMLFAEALTRVGHVSLSFHRHRDCLAIINELIPKPLNKCS